MFSVPAATAPSIIVCHLQCSMPKRSRLRRRHRGLGCVDALGSQARQLMCSTTHT